MQKVLLCPPKVYFPVLCKFWQLYGGVNGNLLHPHPGRPEWPAGSGRWLLEQSAAFLPSPRQRREEEEARLSRHDLLSHGIQGYSWPSGLGSGAGTGSRTSASSSLTSSSLYPPTRSPSRPRPRSLPGVGAELAGANPKVAAVLGWGHRPLALLRGALQSCPTLCDPIDGSPPGSVIPGILQARILEWVAISFSSA